MKFILLFLFSLNIYAQSNHQFELRKLDSKVTKELKSFYFKSGSHILDFGTDKLITSSFAVGLQKKADSFIYGFELLSLGKKDRFSSETAIAHFGYSPTWNHRSKIYLSFLMGIGSMENLTNNQSHQHYYSGLEFGYLLKRFDVFDINLAMRKNYFNISDIDINSMESQEVLIKMSVEY
jgi:hypothetical protein